MTWTLEKQQLLEMLQKEKEHHDQTLRAEVGAVVDGFYFYNMAADAVADALIKEADNVIKALVPYSRAGWRRG